MFLNGIHLNWHTYWKALSTIVHSVSHLPNMIYTEKYASSYKVFPTYWEFYFYSLTIFIAAFLVALLVGLILTYLTVLQSNRTIDRISKFLSFFESIPDLFFIFCLNSIVIYIFQKTGILFVNIAGAFDKVYLLPIVTLAVIPSILLFRIFLLAVTQESLELYVDLAKTKGLAKSRIILVHIYRNALITLASHLKSIFFFMFSSLVMVEYLFNIYGITYYVMDHLKLDIFAVTILLFYVPIFLVMAVIQIAAERLTGRRVAI